MKLFWPAKSLLLSALILSIPAFYLVLTGPQPSYRNAGHWLYGAVAAMVAADMFFTRRKGKPDWISRVSKADIFILIGALASAWPAASPWTAIEWLLRLAYCGVVFIRLASLLAQHIAPHRLLQIIVLAVFGLAIAGAGFFWLEPKVQTYADGVWLAFITGATVGYGDLVPSTPASRIFAVFIVLLGYTLFSIVTASIAAFLVGEDEKRLQRELHSDMRLLRGEIAALRAELAENSGIFQHQIKLMRTDIANFSRLALNRRPRPCPPSATPAHPSHNAALQTDTPGSRHTPATAA
jgi:voltage-gated potassium channel